MAHIQGVVVAATTGKVDATVAQEIGCVAPACSATRIGWCNGSTVTAGARADALCLCRNVGKDRELGHVLDFLAN